MKKINRESLLELIQQNRNPNTIFHVAFLKKNGELRRMKCMLGVKKYLKGGDLTYNPSERGYLIVLDVDKQAYRTINLETISNVSMKGVEYYVTG